MIVELTCRTPDCENQDFVIAYPDPAETVICGVCNNEITDKKPRSES